MEYAVKVNGGTAGKLSRFRELIESFITYGRENSAEDTATFIVKRSEIYSTFLTDQSVEGISRRENLEELLKGIVEFSQIRREEGIENVSIADFLSEVALLSDQDNDRNEFSDKVTLMTVHAAKGLEFKNVFVAGLEEDLFPSQMSKDSMRAIEEERRLFYVAITRAEENCVLSYAKSRFRNGKTSVCSPSRFLKDIDRQYLESTEGSFARAGSFEKEGEIYERPAFQSPFRQKQPVEVSSRIPLPATSPVSSGFPPINIEGLQVGSHIRHDRFGEGEVIAIEGEGGNTKATVVFNHFGQKQLLLKFAKFTVLR
jgi:DNA helicase-2/ATP-dependent DNA helicase PcrA